MHETQDSNDHESKLRVSIDIGTQFVPIPAPNGATSSCGSSSPPSAPHPPSFDGDGGEFSGAGASHAWSECDRLTDVSSSVVEASSEVAGAAGSVVVDALSVLLPF